MRGVKIDLIARGAADSCRENRETPIKITGAAKCARGNQYGFAFPERGDQDREISVLRQ